MTASRQTTRASRPYPAGRRGGPRHRGIAVAAVLMAVAALAGAVGLTGGSIDLGEPITRRLPLHSPVLGGTALLLIVALPMTAAAVAAWRGVTRAPEIVTTAGLALLGWIAVEVAFIRTFSWLQPVCAGYGALLAAAGWWLARPGRRGESSG